MTPLQAQLVIDTLLNDPAGAVLPMARTQPRQSWSTECDAFYKEWSLVMVSDAGHSLLLKHFESSATRRDLFVADPCVLLERRVDIVNGQEKPWEWCMFRLGDPWKCVYFQGDNWRDAESLHPLHAFAVDAIRRVNELARDLDTLKETMRQHNAGVFSQDRLKAILKERGLLKRYRANALSDQELSDIYAVVRAEDATRAEELRAQHGALVAEIGRLASGEGHPAVPVTLRGWLDDRAAGRK